MCTNEYKLLRLKLDKIEQKKKKEDNDWAWKELVRIRKILGAYDATLNDMSDRKQLVEISNEICLHNNKINRTVKTKDG